MLKKFNKVLVYIVKKISTPYSELRQMNLTL